MYKHQVHLLNFIVKVSKVKEEKLFNANLKYVILSVSYPGVSMHC